MSELSNEENIIKPTNNIVAEKEDEGKVEILPPSFDRELRTFIDHITSLYATLEIAMSAINEALLKTKKLFEEFAKEYIIQREENGKNVILVTAENFHQFETLNKQLRAYHLALITVPRSYIMALISQYDAFLGRLIRVIFLAKPELLNVSDRNLTFAQLVEFGSIDDAKEFILEKEVESVLRRSHAEQFEWIESKFNIKLRKGLEVWPDFIEITERRNLFVHTGGFVSDQYLKSCKEHNVVLNNVKNGDELHVNKEYFEHAYNVIFEIGFQLGQVLWRKFKPDELEKADNNLIDIGYDILSEENYQLTKTIFNFATLTLKKHSSEEKNCIMVVNRALAYKWSGDNKKAKEIIELEDWSAASARFKLAKAVLLDNYDDAYELMQTIGKNDKEVVKENYRQWPLFKGIKVETKFQEVFGKIFGEPYNKIAPNSISSTQNLTPKDQI